MRFLKGLRGNQFEFGVPTDAAPVRQLKFKVRHCLALCLASAFALLVAEPFSASAVSKPQKIILEHADTLRSRGDERELIGNVLAHRSSQTMSANHGVYNSSSGIITLMGDVELSDPEQSLKASYISYNENNGNYEAIGGVDYQRPDSVRIRCESAQFTEAWQRLDLYRNVVVENLNDGTRITGGYGNWNEETSIAYVESKPVYRRPQPKTNPPDTLTIWSGRLKYDRPQNNALFTRDVNLLIGEVEAVADTLFHEPDSNRTTLNGSPIIWRKADQLSGKQIILTFEKNELKTVWITGDALMLSEAHAGDDRTNRLNGREALITIVNDSSRHVHAEGDALAEYHVWDEKDVYQGVNLSAGDVIELMFQGKKAQQITLMGSVNGSFYPPRFAPPLEPRKPREDKRRRNGM